jgi:Mce-associated membrane protein
VADDDDLEGRMTSSTEAETAATGPAAGDGPGPADASGGTDTTGGVAPPAAVSWLRARSPRVRSLGRARLVPLALAVLVALAALLVAVQGWRAVSDARLRDSQDAAVAAARAGTAQVLSYSPKNVQADLEASRKLVSGAFAAKFDQLATQVILPATQAQGLSTKAAVVRVAVVDATADQAHLVLFVNQSTTVKDQSGEQNSTNQIGVTMTRSGGQWLISDLQAL